MNNNGICAAKRPCSESQIKGNDGKVTEKWKLQYHRMLSLFKLRGDVHTCRKCLDLVTQCPSKTKLGAMDILKNCSRRIICKN